VQRADAALIVDGHPAIVARSGADGAHLRSITEFEEAVDALRPDRIAGAGGLISRHDAMTAAERGADYVMFGEPTPEGERPTLDAIAERVSWWAEVFEAPCVAYAGSLDDIVLLAEAGADFIALGDFIFADPRGVAVAVADAASRLSSKEAVT
jgi:thiamine-phosphate pyrophosphorylase